MIKPSTDQIGISKAILNLLGAFGMTVLLIAFLILTRYLDRNSIPDQTIREVETIEPIALSAPPPPLEIPETETPPPPPPRIDIPRLDVQLNSTAPAITATTEPKLDLTMETSEFSVISEPVVAPPAPPVKKTVYKKPTPAPPKPAPVRSTYSAGELDSKPYLVNSPSVSYPSSMRRKGSPTGKVVLEVSISSSGRVSVRRVLGSNHSEFSSVARSFASRARFSVPKKNGRPVTAIYKWPIVLKP